MAEFLDGFDVERSALLSALAHTEQVWGRFQQQRGLEVEGSVDSDSLIADELSRVRAELESTEFTVGIFGLIKRGKSTLLNALIGAEVSSMHVTPETAVPVYVSYGDAAEATVYFADGSIRHVAVEEVHRFTSQKANPQNRLGVTVVHQQVPVGFLRNGPRLIDTPGLDDADADDVYTERTLQELDVVDAGIVLFLSPPTVSATELRFLEEVVARDLKKTFLVCNMFPQHFHDRETRTAVLDYVGGRIVEASRRAGRSGDVWVYPVCALEAWQARQNDDILQWRRSGADRLLRDVENYLSCFAGRQTLRMGADRIVHAVAIAQAEVGVRQQLLSDPQQLQTFRHDLDRNILALEHGFDEVLNLALTDVAPLKIRIRSLVLQPFSRAKQDLEALSTVEEIDAFAARFRRQLEVAGELASRQFAEGFEHLVARLQSQLEQRFQSVITELGTSAGDVRLPANALLVTPDQLQQMRAHEHRSRTGTRTGAVAAGGLAGGSVAFVAAGAMLGPVGLIAGALVGWKMSDLVAGHRSLERARAAILERLDEIAGDLLGEGDHQVSHAIENLRTSVTRHRRAFAADLYQQFDLVHAISADAEALESYRRDAARFEQAFDRCSQAARRAVLPPEDLRESASA